METRELFFIFGALILISTFYHIGKQKGQEQNQTVIENRTKKTTEKNCYTHQDLELIIWGETQE